MSNTEDKAVKEVFKNLVKAGARPTGPDTAAVGAIHGARKVLKAIGWTDEELDKVGWMALAELDKETVK